MTRKGKNWIKSIMGTGGTYFLVVLVVSIGAAYFFTGGKLFTSWRYFGIGTTWSMAIWYSQSLGNGYIIDRLDERISWLTHPWKRVTIGFLSLVVYSFVAFQIIQLTFGYFFFGWEQGEFFQSENFWKLFWFNGRIAVIISLSISTVLTSVGFFRGWREQAVKAERLEKEVYVQRYEALRNQLNPHFLFNSLNVLTELVYDDQELAVRFIRKMSDVYRYVLDSRDHELVPLEEELRFIEDYVGLLKERFAENLQVEFVDSLREQKAKYIVPMSLQLLMENAVKHNVVSTADPLNVCFTMNGNRIEVVNGLQLKNGEVPSGQLGLSYLQKRYDSYAQGEVEITQTETHFSVSIPLLELENEA
ncbi:MAG: histidine kinase [Flavobacteriales bacterium]|nr:histidine kinase [Flavobacteriales bacterium]